MNKQWMLVGVLLFAMVGCSSVPEESAEAPINESSQPAASATSEPDFDFSDPRDPFEDINRPFWDFNRNTLDPYVIQPVVNTWEYIPSPVRRGLYNMTDNLNEPASIVNNVLQLKFKDAATSAGRFTINSTIGLLGFFDVARKFGLEEQRETFGETMAVYGSPDGPYFMLPGLGPTVLIDRGGDFVDDYIWPATLFSWQFSAIRLMIRGLEQRLELRQLEPVLENSIDEYSFVREAYFSYWRDKVYDGNPPPEENNWDDEWSNEWDEEWEN